MPHLKGHSGIDWHYDLEGEGRILFFIHGWGVDKRIWRQQTKFFSQYYKVLSLDLPGHGKSSWKKVQLQAMAEDVNGFLRVLELKDITCIGSSLGGLLALKLYAINPDVITEIVFVGSMPKFSKSEDYPFGLDVGKMRKLGGQLDSDYPSIVNVFFRSLFTREERQSRRFKWLQKFRQNEQAPVQQALVEYLDILEQEDLRDVLKSVKVPMQFINGSQDDICSRETVHYLQEVKPEARYDFFDRCGHFPFLSKPHEFNQTLESFLEQTE